MSDQTSLLRVAHLHTNLEWGGGETQLLALARRMQARGMFTVLVTPSRSALFVRARQAGVRVMALEKGRRARRRLREELDEFDLTLLHAHDSGATALGQSLRRALQVPLVLTRRIASPLRRNLLSRRKYSPSRLDAVIAISETVRDVMIRGGYPAERIRIAPSGVDIAALSALRVDLSFRAGLGDDFLVGGIGKLSAKKNWMLMVGAAEILARDGFPLQWMLIGEGPERGALEAAVRAAGLDGRFRLPGFRADATHWLRQFDLLCFPSRMEGASVTVREAMALGVPTVATDAPGVVESLAGLGWIVDGDDPAALAATIRQVLEDAGVRTKRAEQTRRYALEHYDYDRMVEQTLAAYAAMQA